MKRLEIVRYEIEARNIGEDDAVTDYLRSKGFEFVPAQNHEWSEIHDPTEKWRERVTREAVGYFNAHKFLRFTIEAQKNSRLEEELDLFLAQQSGRDSNPSDLPRTPSSGA